jgi:glycosyltransferase involved in cell wall biosynthesis
MDRKMMITVGVCTWNHSKLLDMALGEMEKLTVPQDIDWELLVVNNNCTDDTDAMIDKYKTKLPIRRLFEPAPGLSNARNCAIREGRGDYFVWTDDDVLVDKEWITEYCKAFRRWPDAAVFGGPIDPWFLENPPDWIMEVFPAVKMAYSILDYGKNFAPITADLIPYGANFAVRAPEQRMHLFNPDLGIKKKIPVGFEEMEMVRSLLKDGAPGWWVPAARVRHYIPKERLTLRYLRFKISNHFKTDVRLSPPSEQGKKVLFLGRPRWLWRALAKSQLDYCIHRIQRKPGLWIVDFKKAIYLWWLFVEYPSIHKI